LSHYESFEHYHSTFYKHVEALSVTPFSAGATARGLAALLVSLVRQPGFEFNSNDKAMLMATQRGHQYVKDAIEAITRRAELIAGVEAAEEVRQQLKRKMDLWQKRAQRTAQGNQLGYETKKDGVTIGCFASRASSRDEFTCPTRCVRCRADRQPDSWMISAWTTMAAVVRNEVGTAP
jgi:hypothetical protein